MCLSARPHRGCSGYDRQTPARCLVPGKQQPATDRISPDARVAHIPGSALNMMDPQKLHDDISHILLHAWIATYLGAQSTAAGAARTAFPSGLRAQTSKLQESAVQLAAALEKMRIANAKLAARMAEHRAFFAKYQTPE
jgi:hypothetical protein